MIEVQSSLLISVPPTQTASTTNSMIVAFAGSLTTYSSVIGLWGSGSARYLTTGSYYLNAEGYNLSDYAPSAGFDKYALAYKVGTGTSRAAINGTLFAGTRNTTSTYIPTGFYFGGTHTQRIARLTYYPVRLPDAQLQELTR